MIVYVAIMYAWIGGHLLVTVDQHRYADPLTCEAAVAMWQRSPTAYPEQFRGGVCNRVAILK